MAKRRKNNGSAAAQAPLAQPDRSGPAVDEQTLFKIAEQRQLFQQANARIASKQAGKRRTKKRHRKRKSASSDEEEDDDDDDDDDDDADELASTARLVEGMLWTTSLSMLHFTFDVLVQHQYGTEIDWIQILNRAIYAWAGMLSSHSVHWYCGANLPVFLLLFTALHGYETNDVLIPGVPVRYQDHLRQLCFFVMSVVSGCFLVHITNRKGFVANQKQAPPVGCLWIWAAIELELGWATLGLALPMLYMYMGG